MIVWRECFGQQILVHSIMFRKVLNKMNRYSFWLISNINFAHRCSWIPAFIVNHVIFFHPWFCPLKPHVCLNVSHSFESIPIVYQDGLSINSYNEKRLINTLLCFPFLGSPQRKKTQLRKVKRTPDIEERMLFHGTGHSNVQAICTYNFDWRLTGSHGDVYGKGRPILHVVVSSCSSYLSTYFLSGSYVNFPLLFSRELLRKRRQIL